MKCAHKLQIMMMSSTPTRSLRSSSLGILASESLVALTVPVNRSEHLREAVHHFVSRDEGLLRSIKLSLSSVEDKTNVAWMKMDIFILGSGDALQRLS